MDWFSISIVILTGIALLVVVPLIVIGILYFVILAVSSSTH